MTNYIKEYMERRRERANINISTSGINVDFPFNDQGINAAIALLNSLKISKKIN